MTITSYFTEKGSQLISISSNSLPLNGQWITDGSFLLGYLSPVSGWSNKINSILSYTKIEGILNTNIKTINNI